MYKKDEKKIVFTDIEDSLALVISSFSTITSYENQTKKSITNKFIQEAITKFLFFRLFLYFFYLQEPDLQVYLHQLCSR